MPRTNLRIVGSFEADVPSIAWLNQTAEVIHAALEEYLDESTPDFRMGYVAVDALAQVSGPTGTPGARSSDPETSKRAALEAAPRAKTQRRKALEAICSAYAMEGRAVTYVDVGEVTGINGVWKRISELLAGKWIYVAGERTLSETGSTVQTYRPTGRAMDWWSSGRA